MIAAAARHRAANGTARTAAPHCTARPATPRLSPRTPHGPRPPRLMPLRMGMARTAVAAPIRPAVLAHTGPVSRP